MTARRESTQEARPCSATFGVSTVRTADHPALRTDRNSQIAHEQSASQDQTGAYRHPDGVCDIEVDPNRSRDRQGDTRLALPLPDGRGSD